MAIIYNFKFLSQKFLSLPTNSIQFWQTFHRTIGNSSNCALDTDFIKHLSLTCVWLKYVYFAN